MNNIYIELIELQNSICELENQNKTSEAVEKLKEYLNKIKSIGAYSALNWPIAWTQTVWDFAKKLQNITKNKANLSLYIIEVQQSIQESKDIIEPLEFILGELSWDQVSQNQSEKSKLLIKGLYEKYPYNYEFKHTYAHILLSEGDFEQSTSLYRECVAIWKYGAPNVIGIAATSEYKLADQYLRDKKYELSREIVLKAQEFEYYINNPSIAIIFFTFLDRIKDNQRFDEQIDSNNSTFNEKVEELNKKSEENKSIFENLKEEFEKAQKKSIETLGIFSAIIAFVITAATAAANKPNIELAVPVLLSMGLILFLFVFGISYRSNGPKKTKDSIYFFLILVLVLLLIVALPYLFKTLPTSALENKNSFEVNATINSVESVNNNLKAVPNHKKIPK